MTKPMRRTLSLLFLFPSCGVAKARIDSTKYECKTCGRRFATFQALGGHCTTHKRGRPGDRPAAARCMQRRVHGCAVCGMEFSMGQALGGHMRRHKPLSPQQALRLDLNSPPAKDVLQEAHEAPLLNFFR